MFLLLLQFLKLHVSIFKIYDGISGQEFHNCLFCFMSLNIYVEVILYLQQNLDILFPFKNQLRNLLKFYGLNEINKAISLSGKCVCNLQFTKMRHAHLFLKIFLADKRFVLNFLITTVVQVNRLKQYGIIGNFLQAERSLCLLISYRNPNSGGHPL